MYYHGRNHKNRNAYKIYNPFSQNPKLALDEVSLSVKEGEFISFMGRSGLRKNKLCLIFYQQLMILQREIIYLWQKLYLKCQIVKKPILEKKTLDFIFQNFNLLDTLTIRENIQLPLKLAKKKVDQDDFDRIVSELEITDILDKYPFECSGGQTQRVAVARTLVMHTKDLFLLMNQQEILMAVRSKQLMQYLEKINKEDNITVIMVTHDPLDAAYSSQNVLY